MSSSSAPVEAVNALRALLDEKGRWTIVTHYNPDADALGSSLGLWHVLNASGHDVRVVLPNTPPDNLHWMPGYGECLAFDQEPDESQRVLRMSDAVFCLDLNKPDRVGGLEQALRDAGRCVLIDHHRDPDGFAAINFSDVTACATSQMLVDILEALGWRDRIGASAATCFYAGIMMDSGSFRFSSTTPHTLEVAADLMRLGAVPERIHSAILDDNSADRMRLLGFALSERMTVDLELGMALITLSRSDLDRFNFKPGDTEGFVNHGLSIRGVRLAAFIVERPDVVKLSLRSKGALPVNEFLAQHFSGGGHANAAGGQAKEPMRSVVDRFLKEIPAFLAKHPA